MASVRGGRARLKPLRGNDHAARISRGRIAGAEVAVISLRSALPPATARALTEAERAVAAALVEGETYAAIAVRRGTATRTIANQARAIFKKLGVGSRAELIRRVVTDGE